MNLEELISIKTASQRSGLSERHLRLLLEQGKIKGVKIGHNWVTTAAFVDEYLQGTRKPGRKPAPKSPRAQ